MKVKETFVMVGAGIILYRFENGQRACFTLSANPSILFISEEEELQIMTNYADRLAV